MTWQWLSHSNHQNYAAMCDTDDYLFKDLREYTSSFSSLKVELEAWGYKYLIFWLAGLSLLTTPQQTTR